MMFKISDCVHGEIELPNYTRDIINSSTFQRLRFLKQLGVSNYFYVNAIHSRYSHCIGTAYLCQKILNIIQDNSNIIIDETHKKCVILAGLCHDLGHGPFSHLWEHCVRQSSDKEWTHENQSVLMIHHMINSNNIKLNDDIKIHDKMLELICALIIGDSESWSRLLKPSEIFLTEIVSNKFCQIDVDKCDYLLRDFHYVGVEIEPFMQFIFRARVVFDDQNVSHIGYHADDFHLIENMFINRANYHQTVYQLPQVAGIEKQLRDICLLAERGGFKIHGSSITEVQKDCNLYIKLDDTVLDLIRDEKEIYNREIVEAQKLISNLDSGKFYKYIWESKDNEEVTYIYDNLVSKFGGNFCKVKKMIPNAQIPRNIPLYDNDNNLVVKISRHDLAYESTIIFCTAFDETTVQNISNYLSNNNVVL